MDDKLYNIQENNFIDILNIFELSQKNFIDITGIIMANKFNIPGDDFFNYSDNQMYLMNSRKIKFNNIYDLIYILLCYIPKYQKRDLSNKEYIDWIINDRIIYDKNGNIGLHLEPGDIFNVYTNLKYILNTNTIYFFTINNKNFIVNNPILNSVNDSNLVLSCNVVTFALRKLSIVSILE